MSGDLSDSGRRALVTGSLLGLPAAALALSAAGSARAQGGGGEASPPVLVPSFAQATSIAVPAGAGAVVTLGYRQPGDGGGGLYQPASGAAPGPGLLKTADGRSWRLAETRPNPRMFGALYADGADDTQALRDLLAYVEANRLAECDLLSGVMRLGGDVRLPANVAYRMGDVTFDFSGGGPGGFRGGACVICDGGPPMRLPGLARDVQPGDDELAFAGDAPLAADDLVVLYNPADFSFSRYRPYYRAGEPLRVAGASGGSVHLVGAAFDSYPAAVVQAWKPPRATLRLDGRLRIIASAGVDVGVQLRRLRDIDISGLSVTGSRLTALQLVECHNVVGRGVRAGEVNNSGQGDDYGLVLASCQDVDIQGQFNGFRHGAATGASPAAPGALQIPCRLIRLSGSFANLNPRLQSVGIHGNTEYWRVEGDILGGVTVAGDHGEVRGLLRLKRGGVSTIHGSELSGANFLIDATHLCPSARPQDLSVGLIDFGASKELNDKTRRGGVIRLRGVIDAPQSTSPVRIYTNGYQGAEPINVDLNGLVLARSAPASVVTVGLANSPPGLNVDLNGFVDQTGAVTLSKGPAVKVRGAL